MVTPRELKIMYEQGTNVMDFLRKQEGVKGNTEEMIEVAYDLQSGGDIAYMSDKAMAEYQDNYNREIATIITSLCKPVSVLEAGVGDGVTLAGVLGYLGAAVRGYGFDLSWSRVAHAKRYIQHTSGINPTLCTGTMFNIPFADNSIDVVYSSHSIEPNGGKEEPILRELYRVTRKFLILVEPGYELANDEARQRMDFHGYCKNLPGIAEFLGYKVLEHKLFPYTSDPLNPTAVTLIEKNIDAKEPSSILACPKFKTRLEEIGGMLYSQEALVVYMIVGGIPCLKIENGILASKYPEFITDEPASFKK